MEEPFRSARQRPEGLEQVERTDDVRIDELAWRVNAAIDMALGREVHHEVRIDAREQFVDRSAISDVHPFEPVVGCGLDGRQVRQIGRVGQLVDVDEFVFRVSGNEKVEEVRADEPRSAGDNYLHDALR